MSPISDIATTLGLDDREILAGFITVTCISRSYEVETITDIIELFDAQCCDLTIDDSLDTLSLILTTGRIMDLKQEVKQPEEINRLASEVKAELIRSGEAPTMEAHEFLCAYLAATIVANTEKVESYKEIVNLWKRCTEIFTFGTHKDLIALILTTGRILELRIEVAHPNEAKMIYDQMMSEIEASGEVPDNAYMSISAALLTAAFIEITPKMERIKDIIGTYNWVQSEIEIESQFDLMSSILASARIKDLDARHMLLRQSISDIIKRIKQSLKDKSNCVTVA